MTESLATYTCVDKGGRYMLLGIAKPEFPTSIPSYFKALGLSIGAGQSRKENVNVHLGPKGILVYQRDPTAASLPSGNEWTDVVVYQDIKTGQLFHRRPVDFASRMEIEI